MSKVQLTSSMRSNLLSLQNTTKLQGITQERLATGLKVNSAIDNPSAYYTAQSLSNRASDLSALLDSLSQGIQTIKATNTTIETATNFLAQAASVATQALETAKIPSKDWFETQENVAAVVTNFDELKTALASGAKGDFVIYGNIEATETINLGEGQNLVGIGYYGDFDTEVDKFSQITFDLERDGLTDGIKASADGLTIADLSIKATTRKSVDSKIIHFYRTQNHTLQNFDIVMDNKKQDELAKTCYGIWGGENIKIYGSNYICDIGANKACSVGIYSSKISLYGKINIHLGSQGRGIGNSEPSYSTKLNLYGDSQLNIIAGHRGVDSSVISMYDNSSININNKNSWGAFIYGELNINDYATVNLTSGHAMYTTVTSNGTLYPLSVNQNSVNAKINVTTDELFSNNSNSLTFNAVEGSQMSVNGKVYEAKKDVSDNTMDGNTMPDGFEEVAGAKAEEIPSLSWLEEMNASRDLMGYNKDIDNSQYSNLLSQYDNLIKDGSYKGINLLKNDKLNMRFNETGTSSLEITGVDASANALGLSTSSWQTQTDIAQSLAEIASALNSLRDISAQFGNYYSILTNREEFTENLINVLEEGADKLTLADMSEESANMLSLQTRQQLATNALSLSSQASQSILKLF